MMMVVSDSLCFCLFLFRLFASFRLVNSSLRCFLYSLSTFATSKSDLTFFCCQSVKILSQYGNDAFPVCIIVLSHAVLMILQGRSYFFHFSMYLISGLVRIL